MARQATLEIQLDVEESDAEELAELTARLRRELLLARRRLGRPVGRRRGARGREGGRPDGDRLADRQPRAQRRDAGSVVRAVQGWLGSSSSRTVKLQLDGDSIELSGVKSSDQQRLIDLWIERHAVAT